MVAAMLTRYTISLRSSAGFPCAQLRQHSVAVGASGRESVASRCATAAAAFVATHSFNGWRCCPIPTFAKTSLGNSFASSLHSHVASILRRLIGLTFIAPWVRRGTRSISPMPAAAALLQSICSGSLNVAQPLSDIELQAARRHFFGGIATNCLNNSEFVPLSPSSSPLRTASSSPNVALFNVLPWQESGVAVTYKLGKPILSRTSTI